MSERVLKSILDGWMYGILGLMTSMFVLWALVVDTGTFVRIETSKFSPNGVISYVRSAPFDVPVHVHVEVISANGFQCLNPGNPLHDVVASGTRVVTFNIAAWAPECIGPGSLHRAWIKYGIFRTIRIETLAAVDDPEQLRLGEEPRERILNSPPTRRLPH